MDHARAVFPSEESAGMFMAGPNPALGWRIPDEVARTEEGAQEVEIVLGRIEHGVFS